MLDSPKFDQPYDEMMATNELVPFVLHNFIADLVVKLIPLVIRANNLLLDFISEGMANIIAENPTESASNLVVIELAYYEYFGRLITIFKISYQYYCEVMKHESTLIVRLLDFMSNLFSCNESETESLRKKIVRLKDLMKSSFKWTDIEVNYPERMEISIKGAVAILENINTRFLSLTQFIDDFNVKID